MGRTRGNASRGVASDRIRAARDALRQTGFLTDRLQSGSLASRGIPKRVSRPLARPLGVGKAGAKSLTARLRKGLARGPRSRIQRTASG